MDFWKKTGKKEEMENYSFGDFEKKINARDDSIAALAAIFLSVFSLAGIALFFSGQQEVPGNSLIYFNDYSSALQDGMANFSFAIENHETEKTVYSLEYFIGNSRIFSEEVSVEKGFTATVQRSFSILGRNYSLPEKFTVKAKASSGKTYSLWFWVRGK